ncbi:MAG: hypothetical protein H8K03_14405 [Nitrospira sp.]
MNFKQFRRPANGHARTAFAGGRKVGGRGLRLQSKLGKAIDLQRLESLLAEARKPNMSRSCESQSTLIERKETT